MLSSEALLLVVTSHLHVHIMPMSTNQYIEMTVNHSRC